jgi:hypothetical protein
MVQSLVGRLEKLGSFGESEDPGGADSYCPNKSTVKMAPAGWLSLTEMEPP